MGRRGMRSLMLPLLSLTVGLFGGCSRPRTVTPAQVQRAQATLLPLKQQLQSELIAALDGGPVPALEVCKVRAPQIAAELSQGGVHMGRTSHRLRNPANAPEAWVQPLLQHYVDHPHDRKPRAIGTNAKRYGYVEPITMRPLCTACHGSHLDASVEKMLAELYPQDEATGFAAGDFRGLFWVTLPWNDPLQESR